MCHFKPGVLGSFLNRHETEQMIQSNYGESMLKDYRANQKIIEQRVPINSGTQSVNKKQIISEGKVARKCIIPVTQSTFAAELNPHIFKFKISNIEDFLNGDKIKQKQAQIVED